MPAFYLDENAVTNDGGLFTAAPDFNLVDVDRVEVLRGPQGTIIGANAMGGAIRIITNQPDASEASQNYEGIFSSTAHGGNNYEFNATLNQPLAADRSAVRLTAYYRNADGFIDDIGQENENANSDKTVGVRLSANTLIGDKLKLTGKIQYQNLEAGAFNFVDPNGKPEAGLIIDSDYQMALMSPETLDEALTIFGLTADYATTWGDWVSATSWFESESDIRIDLSDEMFYGFGTYYPAQFQIHIEQKVFSQEIRFVSSPGDTINWLAGAFYLNQKTPRHDYLPAPGFNDICDGCTGQPDGEEVLLDSSFEEKRRDLAFFGEISYRFNERLEATAGARWYEIKKDQYGVGSGIFAGGDDVITDLDSKDDGVIPKFSLDWTINNDAMLYALASKGFRPGGANEVAAVITCDAPETYGPDELWNYEIGAKTSWFDKRLTFNTTIYHMDWSEVQVLEQSTCDFISTINAGEATSNGLEMELYAVISNSWELQASLGYNKTTFDDDVPELNAPAGTEFPNAPGITASLAATYYYPLGERFNGFVRADLQFTDSTYTEHDIEYREILPSYTLFNLRVGFTDDHWWVTLFADNLFDEKATTYCCRLNGEYTINRPRTIGLRTGYQF